MYITKCENGHFYDADKFIKCPNCEGESTSAREMNNDPVIICTCCGMAIFEDVIFCPYCGTKLAEVTSSPAHIYNKNKCKLLREIRKNIATLNNIDMEFPECESTDFCMGTCPVCEAEIKALDDAIMQKTNAGEECFMPTIQVDGRIAVTKPVAPPVDIPPLAGIPTVNIPPLEGIPAITPSEPEKKPKKKLWKR